jgi:hypothetical protein
MSDLEPDLHEPVIEDPSVTRLLLRRADGGRCAELLERIDAVATSVSVVVPEGGAGGHAVVDAMGRWVSERVRVELLIMEGDSDPGRPVLRERLARSGRPWRSVSRPAGGRAAVLGAAAAAAEHEFVLVGSGGSPHYELVDTALSFMWAEGADVALIHAGPEDRVDPDDMVDPSMALSTWLGLRTVTPEGRLVLMRRWVARWLFNEITRAISPADEVADRTRLLGVGIVEVATFASDEPLPRS